MILALLQARLSSTRLPGKVLKPILGEPMLFRQIERINRAKLINRLVIATSSDPSDDELADLCKVRGVECFRGSLDDVLDRFYQAADWYTPEHVVRLTGDCPLIDPELIDNVIKFHIDGAYDYSSNCLEPTYPDGLDTEIFTFKCLREAWSEARLPSEREHVTPFINQQPTRYKLGCVKGAMDYSAMRWTVDELADFDFVSSIYELLYPGNPVFSSIDVIKLLASRPELSERNANIVRNAGYIKSLQKDAAYVSKGAK